MKIVITDGLHEADYIISTYKSRNNDLIIINSSEEACKYLSVNNDVSVVFGKPTRENDLRDAGAEDADLLIALSKNDMDNYIICKTAKQLLNVKKVIATVLNPKNVDVFKRLGVDSAVSATYLLGEQIRNAASIENLINTLSLEENKIIILELKISADLRVRGKTLKDLNVSDKGSISTIVRGQKIIIPNGNTELLENDKVLIVTTEENHEEMLAIFQRKA